MTKIEKQLEQARADRDAINQELTALEASEAEASKVSATFAKWRALVFEKEGERERLSTCIATLEAESEQAQRDAARADLLSRRAALEKQTAALARRITEEGTKSSAVLVQLAEEAAANVVDVEALNRELSHDEQLIHADHIARHRDPAPRKNLEETIVDLWVHEGTMQLVNDQDAVIGLSNGHGIIPATEHSLANKRVVRKRFKQVRYLEAGHREYADPLGSTLRLPRFDAPGVAFDYGHKVEAARRKELLELIPATDAPAKPARSPDGRT